MQEQQTKAAKGLTVLTSAYELGHEYGVLGANTPEDKKQLIGQDEEGIAWTGVWTSYNNISALWELQRRAGEDMKAAREAFILGYRDGVLDEFARQVDPQ